MQSDTTPATAHDISFKKSTDDWRIKVMKRKINYLLEEIEAFPTDTAKQLMYKGAMLEAWARLVEMLEKYSVPE